MARTTSIQDLRICKYFNDTFMEGSDFLKLSEDMSGLIEQIVSVMGPDIEDFIPRVRLEEWAKKNGYITPEECE